MKLIIDHFSRRKELIQMLAERGAQWGVEVGTDHGKYAEQLLSIPNLHLECVDPYIAYTEGSKVHTQEEVDLIYQEAFKRLSKYNCFIHKTTSIDAVQGFTENSLDFVFIDGNHSYNFVKEDVTEWTKRVKPGGIVCGHDYKVDKTNNYGVIEAVNEYVREHNISPLFILRGGGRLVDCWLFIKQP